MKAAIFDRFLYCREPGLPRNIHNSRRAGDRVAEESDASPIWFHLIGEREMESFAAIFSDLEDPGSGARNKRPALNEERLKTIIVDEAYRTIKVSEGKRQITIPMAQAVIRALAVNAARGQHRSQQLFAELLSETERANKQQSDEWLKAAIQYKHEWEQRLARRAALGITGPEPLPHPDDIVIDMKTGQVIVKGPMTKEEKVVWDQLRARLDEGAREIEELSAMLKEHKNKRFRHFIEDDIAHEKRLHDIIVNAIGEWPKRDGFAK
jgi:hypothetical protein